MYDASAPRGGIDYPRTFQEFEAWFGSEAACRTYLRRLRWADGFVCPACGVADQPAEMSRGLLQSGIQHQHLDYYLDEFAFRFNRRRSKARGMLFYRLAQQAVAISPVPYRNIINAAGD